MAGWILEELLDDIFSWDDCKETDLEFDTIGPYLDLCSLVMIRDPPLFINCYSLKSTIDHPAVQVCQLKCLEQRASGKCLLLKELLHFRI